MRKNIMSTWKEFNPESGKSMKEDFLETPPENLNIILSYLNSGEVALASPSGAYDVFSNERVLPTRCILTDGEYSWSNMLGYYVTHYNLRIPQELERKILQTT